MASILIHEETAEPILFDSVLEERWTEGVEVTSHPIDRRSPVTDHIQPKQPRLFLRAIVTNSPLESQAGRTGSATKGARPLFLRDRLRELRNDTFQYVSNRTGEISRLVLKEMRYSIDTRLRVVFSLDFVQIEYAETQEGELPPVPRRPRRDPPPESKGGVGRREVDPTQPPPPRSRLEQLRLLLGRASTE